MVQPVIFDVSKWREHFDDSFVGNATFPHNIDEIFRENCPFVSGKQVGNTHSLVWVPSMSCEQLPFGGFDHKGSGYPNYSHEREGGHWVLVTKKKYSK